MIHRVFWTGGWDSTFRVLDLILHWRVTVEPHYIVFSPGEDYRESAPQEQEAMNAIRQALGNSAQRLLPTRAVPRSQIRRDPRIIAQYKQIRRLFYLGDQYALLAEYADQFNVRDLELSIHRDDKARTALASAVDHRSDECGGHYVVDPAADYPAALFEPFRFPLFDLTKLEMRQIAAERGFAELLNLTWFCHTPEEGKPCGLCNPCRYDRRRIDRSNSGGAS